MSETMNNLNGEDFEHFDIYQELAVSTAIYDPSDRETYPLLGLFGEVGEYANKYKKVLRDGKIFNPMDKVAELGDILWYLANLANDANISLADVAAYNVNKLQDRARRDVLGGSGDNR